MLANPRAGIFRGAYSEAPSTATGCIAASAPAFFGPLAAAFLAVFFAAFLWSLRLGNSRSLQGNPLGQLAGIHGRQAACRVPWWATLGRARTRPEHQGEPGDRAACSQPAGRIVAGQSSGVRAEVAGRAAQVASLRAVARRER